MRLLTIYLKQNTEVPLWGTNTGGPDVHIPVPAQENSQIPPDVFDFKLPCHMWNKNKYRIGVIKANS